MKRKKSAAKLQEQLFPLEKITPNLPEESEEEHDATSSRLYAMVKPEMLVWARQYAHFQVEEAAKRIGINAEKLQGWEVGDSLPTINQLHKIAKVYQQSFAVFYLPKPPRPANLPVKDFRRPSTDGVLIISPELAHEIRTAIYRREIALELQENAEEEIPEFKYSASLDDRPSNIAGEIRSLVLSGMKQIPSFTDRGKAFAFFREKLEALGILVFQSSTVSTSEMRGFSISDTTLPIIVINRKDSYSGRIFSLFHEVAHILLRTSGLCDIDPDITQSSAEQKIEVFCNQVAADVLMPEQEFRDSVNRIFIIEQASGFSDEIISRLSNEFGTSREAVVRRLLTLDFVDNNFYRIKRDQYLHEIGKKITKKGGRGIPPAVNVISLAGKPFIHIVFHAINSNRITVNDASGYLDVRIKHFDKVSQLAGV
jgi:Zn-dependent peptidase ImmA (M78 family)/transcriptional regulator with XRE-family HTH domain